MVIEVKLPDTGMGITEGTIVKWHKGPGDRVRQGEILAEFETAKAVAEVAAPVDGVLEKIVVAETGTVEVNTTVALVRGD